MSKENTQKNDEPVESESEENVRLPAGSLALDLGDNCVYNDESNRLEFQAPSGAHGAPEPSNSNVRREDNPFSFKHFLRDTGSSRNYQSLGARPKVYRESRSRHITPPESPQRPPQNARKIGEFSAVLPDFVQDHLVIEQCFLGNKVHSTKNYNLDLPDFAQGDQGTLNGPRVSRSNSAEEPLTGAIPLDLPGISLGNAFPLDLPLAANESINTPMQEVGTSNSLPDFLTDGPVRTNADGSATTSSSIGNGEIKREVSRCHRCLELTAELMSTEQRLTQSQDAVEQHYRRETAAQSKIARLNQELKTLKTQLRQLQSENQSLRDCGGATSLNGADHPLEIQSQRLAHELRTAASTAEHSLRSLLTGVDNLRIMALTLENIHRIEEKPSDMFSRFEDDSAGPAL